MSMSVRTRMLLATNLLTVGVGVAVGWLAIRVASADIERTLLEEPLAQTVRLFAEGDLPRTDPSLLGRMGRILGAEMATGGAEGRDVAASSLPAPRQTLLERQLHGLPSPDRVVLDGQPYRMASAPLAAPRNVPAQESMRLYLLVAEDRILGAQQRVRRTIALSALAAVAAATLVAVWLSHSITRPLRRLTERMDRMRRAAADADLDALLTAGRSDSAPDRAGGRAPAEVARPWRTREPATCRDCTTARGVTPARPILLMVWTPPAGSAS